MRFIIYDFEVFRFDTLLGCKIIFEDGHREYYQTWDLDEIRKFYDENKNNMWVGHNSSGYDDLILEAVIKKQNTYQVSKKIVNQNIRSRCHLNFNSYDSMRGIYSLKMTELAVGKNISETKVDFDLERPLTDKEKIDEEEYNRDDLNQTEENFIASFDVFSLRIDIIKEFNLPMSCLNISGTALAAKVLGAKAIPGIEYQVVKPRMYETLRLKNQELIDYYLQDRFRTNEKLKFMLCGAEHTVGAGGIHAAQRKKRYARALYFDVSGYYNLVMLNLGLLPRTMNPESKEKYRSMYYEQLKLKGVNDVKRAAFKTILLSVFGAMLNEYTDFYDPWHGLLVTITGQLYLVDLLEKLEGLVTVIQSNTDGIMLDLFDWNDRERVINIVEEWESRTGFVIKKEEITNLVQRDVNNYCALKDGHPIVKGEAMNAFDMMHNPVHCQTWSLKEPPIIGHGIAEYLLYGNLPEETLKKHLDDMKYFQFACKKNSYDYLTLDTEDLHTHEITNTRLQNVNRAFASKYSGSLSTVRKHKDRNGKHSAAKIASLPDNVFIFNEDINNVDNREKILERLDLDYYLYRIYERIQEFECTDKIKEIAV